MGDQFGVDDVEVPVAPGIDENRVDHRANLRVAPLRRDRRLDDARGDALEHPLHDGEDEVLFRLVVIDDVRLRHPGSIGDVLQGHPVHPFRRHQTVSKAQQLLLLRRLLAGCERRLGDI
jgi:hypothetical protein